MYVTLNNTAFLALICYKHYFYAVVKARFGGGGGVEASEIENMAGCYWEGVGLVGTIRFFEKRTLVRWRFTVSFNFVLRETSRHLDAFHPDSFPINISEIKFLRRGLGGRLNLRLTHSPKVNNVLASLLPIQPLLWW